jgi:hypothetical protein
MIASRATPGFDPGIPQRQTAANAELYESDLR